MTYETKLLRFLLVLFLLVLALGCGLLYLISLESARNWPTLAHLQLPVFGAMVVGLVPVVLAVKSMFDVLNVMDRGDEFSTRTVQILRRMRLLVGVFAGYFALGFVAFWIATGLMHPTLIFAWLALEVAALFLFTVTSLLVRIFAVASELRQDKELTV